MEAGGGGEGAGMRGWHGVRSGEKRIERTKERITVTLEDSYWSCEQWTRGLMCDGFFIAATSTFWHLNALPRLAIAVVEVSPRRS